MLASTMLGPLAARDAVRETVDCDRPQLSLAVDFAVSLETVGATLRESSEDGLPLKQHVNGFQACVADVLAGAASGLSVTPPTLR
jgi:hypothetical protein